MIDYHDCMKVETRRRCKKKSHEELTHADGRKAGFFLPPTPGLFRGTRLEGVSHIHTAHTLKTRLKPTNNVLRRLPPLGRLSY
jgi:hypothetical protein